MTRLTRRRRRHDARDLVVLVTGASSGIGRATAVAFGRRGARVVLLARSPDSLAAAERETREAGAPGTLVTVADITDRAAVQDAFRRAVARFGRIDAVVANAGVVAYGRFPDVPPDTFERVLTTNVVGAANVARSALKTFEVSGRGSLVVVGSLLGTIAAPYMSPYITSKWAVHGLVRTIQIEARSMPGIDVSLVSPGGVDTPIYAQGANAYGREGRPPPPVDPPEKVARAIVHTVLKGPRRERRVGAMNWAVLFGFRQMPVVYDRIVDPLMRVGGLSRSRVAAGDGNVFAPHPPGNAVHGKWGRHWLRGITALGVAAGIGAGLSAGRQRTPR